MNNHNSSYKRPRREDVARLAGVSVATVSYVLNNSPKPVADETRTRVLAAVEELGYKPHALARSLKTGSTCTVGVVIPVVASPGMAYMASKVQDELSHSGYQAIMANAHEDPEREEHLLEMLTSQPVDGMIVSPASIFETRRFERILKTGIPLVFMDRFARGVSADCVTSDNTGAARQAAAYLASQGCRKILCLSFSLTASSALERVDGYHQALLSAGLPVDPALTLVIRDPIGELAEKAVLEHVELHGLPDGVLCTTQELGLHFLQAFRHQNLPLPEKRVVVFDADWAELLSPPMPTVRQNLHEVAVTAVRLLLDRLNGSTEEPQTVRVPAELIVY